MHETQNHQQGFTLIDLTIYSGLLGILLVILSDIFISVVQLQLSTGSQGAVEQNGAYILSRVTYDIRRASSITSPALGGTETTFSSVLSEFGNDVPYIYDIQNQNLILSIGSNVSQVNSSDTIVRDFSVTRIGNSGQNIAAKDTVQVSFTVESRGVTSQGSKERQYNTVVSLR